MDMHHGASLKPWITVAPDDVTQAAVSVVIMQQFRLVTGSMFTISWQS